MSKLNKTLVKRFFAGALSIAMLVGALTGCGVSTSSNGSDVKAEQTEATTQDESTNTDASTVASAEGKTEIEFWYSGGKTAVGVPCRILERKIKVVNYVISNMSDI